MLTQPSSFNSLASNYFRQSIIYPSIHLRYRVNNPSRFAHFSPYLASNSQYQDNNNNTAYFNEIYDNREPHDHDTMTNEEEESEHNTNSQRIDFSRLGMTARSDHFIDYDDEMRYYSAGLEQEEEIQEEDLSEIDEFVWNTPDEHIGSDIDEEEDMDSDSQNMISSDDSDGEEGEDEDDNNFSFSSKRRRLNSRGKFTKPPVDRIKYNKPTKVIKCKQSKRIRAMAYNPKRNEIAAISMNAAFHYFDVQRFEQVWQKKKIFEQFVSLSSEMCNRISLDYGYVTDCQS